MQGISEDERNKLNQLTVLTVSFVVLFSLFFIGFMKQTAHANAIVITNAVDLQAIGDDEESLAKDYELGDDIDLNGLDWEGIGESSNKAFTGSLDGKGYTISNFKTTQNDSGFIHYAVGATVKNLTFTNAEANNEHVSRSAAILASRFDNGLIENVTIKNSNVFGNGNAAAVVADAGSSDTKFNNVTVTLTNVTGGNYSGLILGSGHNAVIENSVVSGSVTSDGYRVGGMAGRAGMIKDSSANASVTSTYTDNNPAMVGGLVGLIYPGGIDNSYATGNVTASRDQVGGLVGHARGGIDAQIKNSYATGSVTAQTDVGGLVGYHDAYRGHEIIDSYATGTVKGERNVGGLIGAQASEGTGTEAMLIAKSYSESTVESTGDAVNIGGLVGKIANNNASVVSDVYAEGSVSGTNNVGGLVGSNDAATIKRAYAAGSVSGSSSTGGLVGKDLNGVYGSNYYDLDTTNQSDSTGATGKETADMQKRPTFEGWNFTTTWKVAPSDYPKLRDEPFNMLTDIDSNYWGRDDVTEIYETGIMNGSADSSNPGKFVFRPNDDITRAEFAIVIVNALGENTSGTSTGFTDDSEIPSWAKAEVAKAKDLGIVEGDSNGNFNPSNKISRAEIAVMIARAYDLPTVGVGGLGMFEDENQIPAWAEDEVAATVAQEIMGGQESGGKLYFAPADQAMRVEAGLSALRAYY